MNLKVAARTAVRVCASDAGITLSSSVDVTLLWHYISEMTATKKFCYSHSSCSGVKTRRHGGGVMTFTQCCSGIGIKNGWGIYDGRCTACLEGSGTEDDRSSLKHLDAPHGQRSPCFRAVYIKKNSRFNTSVTMASIKDRKRQKFVYCIFACKISWRCYTMSEVDGNQATDLD